MKAAESEAWSTNLRAQAPSLGLGPTLPVRQASPAPQAQWLQPTRDSEWTRRGHEEVAEPPGQALDNHAGNSSNHVLVCSLCPELDLKPVHAIWTCSSTSSVCVTEQLLCADTVPMG